MEFIRCESRKLCLGKNGSCSILGLLFISLLFVHLITVYAFLTFLMLSSFPPIIKAWNKSPLYLKILQGVVIISQHLGQHSVQHSIHELWLEVWGLCSGFRKEKKKFLGRFKIFVSTYSKSAWNAEWFRGFVSKWL